MSGRERLIDSFAANPPQPRTWVAVSLVERVRVWWARRRQTDAWTFDGRRDR